LWWFGFRLETIFAIAPTAPKKWSSIQKWLMIKKYSPPCVSRALHPPFLKPGVDATKLCFLIGLQWVFVVNKNIYFPYKIVYLNSKYVNFYTKMASEVFNTKVNKIVVNMLDPLGFLGIKEYTFEKWISALWYCRRSVAKKNITLTQMNYRRQVLV